jgi:membrane-bound lytic murein transglycosylase F
VQRTAPPGAAAAAAPEAIDTIFKPRDDGKVVVNVKARLVEKPEQLANRRVTLPPKSPYRETLLELRDSIGDIHVVELEETTSTETLIRAVARGDVEFTVADTNLARIQEDYYTNIAIRPVLGQERIVAWAMRRNAPQLKAAIDQWVSSERGRKLLAVLYRKYFVDASGYRERVESKYLTSATGTLSPYDGLFKFYAPRINWDWRLLASQSYQESRFKPTAKSWAGAQGLMQIMPATGREFGVTRLYDPEENIRGGVKYIAWLTKYWEKHISDPGERLKFILASYNTGIGHVEDAQRLALKNGHDSKYWNDVAYWLLQKSKREIYTDPVVKYGFSRGIEPVTYVSLVLERYDHYRQFVVTDSSGQ